MIGALRKVRKESPILFGIAILNLLAAAGAAFGLVLDERELMGLNVWVKPLKFLISVGIYVLTVGYLITFYPYSDRKKHILRNVVAFTLLAENAIIVLQASRGVQSHYNVSNPLDGILFSLMGILIGINVLLMILFALDALRLRLSVPRPVQWAVFFGWSIAVLSSWIGGRMIGRMGHSVGIPDGGEGLPFLNWSTTAGDLRVAHFFGLHALQLLPLCALVLVRIKLPIRSQILAVVLLSLGYAAWVGFIYYQATLHLPFFVP